MRLSAIGFAGRSLLYGLIALLAGRIAVGLPGEAGAQGAFEALADLPLGVAALAALAAALLVFAGWAAVQAAHPRTPLELPDRLGRGVQAGANLAIGLLAARRVLGLGGGGGRPPTAQVMANPVGRWLVAGIGIGLLVAGGVQLLRAWRGDLQEALDDSGAPVWASLVGRAGYAGRGVTLALVGTFVLRAAILFDPSEATGLDSALDELARSTAGRLGVVTVAVGMLALAAWFGLVSRFGVEEEVEGEDVPTSG